jgi:hypothetical protein
MKGPADMRTIGLVLRARTRRLLGLLAFAGLFLAAAIAARVVAGHDGHVEAERLFLVGGYPLVSMLLLLGWLIARFPMIATLVLLAGVFSHERATGMARLDFVRPSSPIRTYAARAAVLAAVAWLLAVLLVPLFDMLILGHWVGYGALVVITTHVLVYGSLTVLLSVLTRGDAWIALFLSLLAMVWHVLRTADRLGNTPAIVRELLTFMLPPQGALMAIEGAFATFQPMPWNAVAFVAGYCAMLLVIAGLLLDRRQI